MGHEIAAGSALDAVRWEDPELGVILGVVATMRHHEYAAFTSRVRQLLNVGKQFFRAGMYSLPPGNMKSAWVSTAHKTRSLAAIPVPACQLLLTPASLYTDCHE